MATGLGQGAAVDRSEPGGAFAAAVLQSLERADGLRWRPTIDELRLLTAEKARAYGRPGSLVQEPIHISHENERGTSENVEVSVSACAEADRETLTPSSLRAWHLPPDWVPGNPRPAPGDAHPARLDVLWCLDRGRFARCASRCARY